MPKYFSEDKIYKSVGTSDFSALTQVQLESFVSILHRISPDMAIVLMNRFLDFRMSANRMVGIIRLKVLKMPKRKEEQSEMRTKCEGLLKELDMRLSQQSITEEDKLFIENHLILLTCLLKANTEAHRKKALKVLSLVGAGVVLITGALLMLAVFIQDNDAAQNESETDRENNDIDAESDNSLDSDHESQTKYQVRMYYPDGTTDLDEEIFETEAEAKEYGEYLVSCCSLGQEILHASNPYEYPDSDYEADFSIVEVDD